MTEENVFHLFLASEQTRLYHQIRLKSFFPEAIQK